MSDKAQPTPGRWPPSTIIAGIMVLVVLSLAAGNALWNRGVEQGKTDARSQYDPTATLREDIQKLQAALNGAMLKLEGLPVTIARIGGIEANMARLETTIGNVSARVDGQQGEISAARERLAVIERTSSIPLPGARR